MKYRDRTIATIDLGSNSILLLVVRRDDTGNVHVLHEGSEVVKLGEKVKETGNITQAALDRTITAIKKYQEEMKNFTIDKVYLTATSAMREAQNQEEIIQAIQTQTTLEVEVLPKVEEVRLTYKSVLAEEPHEAPSLVIDIGGGSTEVGWGIGARYDGGRSLNIGTVKLIEGALSNPNPSANDLQTARNQIDAELAKVMSLGKLDYYYGTAGSFTQAASLELKLAKYSPQAVDHFKLTQKSVEQWISKLASMSEDEKKQLPGIDLKRMDVLLAGFLVIERLHNKFETPEFIVRDRGVRFGKAFDQFREFNPKIIFA